VAVDAAGNVYVADTSNHRVRKLTPTGQLTTLAGDGTPGFADGPGATARFSGPQGVAVDAAGNLCVADAGNHRIRKISAAGVVSTLAGEGSPAFADGPGATARFSTPVGVAVDAAGNVYVGDRINERIRKISPTGVVSTLAGTGTNGFADGPGATAKFSHPEGVAVDAAGNVYVADEDTNRIRKVTPAGVVSTLAGDGTRAFADGPGATARFNAPDGVAVDAAGNVYVADTDNHRLRKITPTGSVSTLAGDAAHATDGQGAFGRFNSPKGVAVDAAGNLYVADRGNHLIRKVTPAGLVSTLAGSISGFADGTVVAAPFRDAEGVAVDAAGNLYVADTDQHRVRKVTPGGVITTLAGGVSGGFSDGQGADARFQNPHGMAVDASGNTYVADWNNHRIRKITPAGVASTLAGDGTAGFVDGPGATARFNGPQGVALDGVGNVYVADGGNQRIRTITPAGVVATLAGSGAAGFADGPGAAAQFSNPLGLALDGVGNDYVSDAGNHRIRKVRPTGEVTSLAGDGTLGFADGPGPSARFAFPQGLAVDGAGKLYVADRDNHRIRVVDPLGVVTTLAGTGSVGFSNGPGSGALFSKPQGLAVDATGTVYVVEEGSPVLRVLRPGR
jgi:sugar lactone lactonase YvrE